MKADITINPSTFDAHVTFNTQDFKSDIDIKNTLAIVSMIAGDFSLDPEIEVGDMKNFVERAKTEDKVALLFTIGEDGLDLEFISS